MSYLLNIDTFSETACLSISKNGSLVNHTKDTSRNHAMSLHLEIDKLLKESAISINDLSAIAVIEGPGSYTGLRVGMATAKGLAFSLNIPLITINSLFLIAQASEKKQHKIAYCPMIDARRMEVFTALYDENFNTILPPCNMILNENSFQEYHETMIMFSGNGCLKIAEIYKGRAFFNFSPDLTVRFCNMSFVKFLKNQFSDLIYTEPLYIKPFYNTKS